MPLLRSRPIHAAGRAGALALAAHAVAACYTNTPVGMDARPVAGATVVADITDRGRVNLGSRIGASPLRVEGQATAFTDSTLTLAVASVEGVRGEVTRWSGESVTLNRSDLSLVQVRRLDRGRSVLLGAIIAGGVVAILVTRSLVVRSSGGSDGAVTQPPPGNNQ